MDYLPKPEHTVHNHRAVKNRIGTSTTLPQIRWPVTLIRPSKILWMHLWSPGFHNTRCTNHRRYSICSTCSMHDGNKRANVAHTCNPHPPESFSPTACRCWPASLPLSTPAWHYYQFCYCHTFLWRLHQKQQKSGSSTLSQLKAAVCMVNIAEV